MSKYKPKPRVPAAIRAYMARLGRKGARKTKRSTCRAGGLARWEGVSAAERRAYAQRLVAARRAAAAVRMAMQVAIEQQDSTGRRSVQEKDGDGS